MSEIRYGTQTCAATLNYMGQSIFGMASPYGSTVDVCELERLGVRITRPAGQILIEDGQKRTARVVALTEVSAISILGHTLLKYLHEHPEVLLGLLCEAHRRFLELSRRYIGSDLSSEIKVATTITELIELGVGQDTASGRRLRFTTRDLGELSGMSRESAVKALGEFQRRGMVETGRGSVTVLDAKALRRIAATGTER